MSHKMRYLAKKQRVKQQVKDDKGAITDGVVEVEIEIPDVESYGLPAYKEGVEFECDSSIAGSLKRWKVAEEVTGARPKPQAAPVSSAATTKSQSTGSGKGASEDDEKKG